MEKQTEEFEFHIFLQEKRNFEDFIRENLIEQLNEISYKFTESEKEPDYQQLLIVVQVLKEIQSKEIINGYLESQGFSSIQHTNDFESRLVKIQKQLAVEMKDEEKLHQIMEKIKALKNIEKHISNEKTFDSLE